jgi:integrase
VHKSKFQMRGDAPQTLQDLLRKASPRLWTTMAHRKSCESNIYDAIEIMGRPMLKDINTAMIDDYVQVVSQGLRNSSINRKLSSLHTILKYAYDREWITKMPKFSWKKEDNERVRWLSKEEEEKLLSILPEEISAFCEILIHTGMRRGELMSVTREQIDGDYLRLWKTKTNKPRSVALSPRAKELVDQWAPFKFSRFALYSAWNKARAEMGLENDRHFVMHMLRHTTATRVLDTTKNIAVVQKVLGHSKINTTMRYAHISDDQLLDAVRMTADKHDISTCN